MTEKHLVAFISEQPIYNLLPIRNVKPGAVLFVGTRERHATNQHLHAFVGNECTVHQTEVHDPYEPTEIYRSLSKKIKKLGWNPDKVLIDMSGGNKMMAFAAHHLALEGNSQLIDLEYIRGRFRFRVYHVREDLASRETDHKLPAIITIADYLNAHLPGFSSADFHKDKKGRFDAGGHFEASIYHAIESDVDEILPSVRPAGVKKQIEIDFVIRRGNNVGIIEAKTGVNKAGIDQLDTAGNPLYSGIHLQKFLVTGRYLTSAYKALALAQNIRVIELPGYTVEHGIPERERFNMIQTIHSALPV